MKKIYKLLIAFIFAIFLANNITAQTDTLYIVKAVFIDAEGTGRSNALEIEFNQPLDDASLTDGDELADWKVSNDPNFTTDLFAILSFETEVEHIANSGLANDQYIRINFPNGPGTGMANDTYTSVYLRYQDQSESDEIYAYYDNSIILQDSDTIKAEDYAGPAILNTTFSSTTGVLKIDDIFTVEFTVSDSITTTGAQCLINNIDRTASLAAISPNTFQIDYTVNEGDSDISEADSIPLFIMVYDTASNAGTPYEESYPSPGIDANKPSISGVSFSPGSGTVVGIGSSINVTITATNLEDNLTANSITINGQTISTDSVTNNSDGTYSFTYTVDESDGDVLDSDPISINFVMEDAAGNLSPAFTTSTASGCPGIDATRPVISGVTFSPGTGNTLKIGDSLRVTISASGEEGLIAHWLSINGKTIQNKDLEDVGAGDYEFYYVIKSGDTDRSDASVIPFSFELKDGSGNVSDAYTESSVIADDCPGIDANKPEITLVEFLPSSTIQGINDEIKVVLTAGESGLSGNSLIINDIVIPNSELADSLDGRYGFTYTILSGDNDVAEDEAIPINFVLEDDAGNLSEEYTTIVATECPGIDANRPEIKSVFFTPGNGTTSIIGETIRIDVTAENNETGLTASTFNVNNIDVSGTFAQDGGGNYHAIYSVAPGNNDINDGTKLPLEIELSDDYNLTYTFTESDIAVDNSPGIDANSPEIDTIYSNADGPGVLKVNDNILFTIEPVTPETNLTFTPDSYNGGDLAWSTSDGGATYTATYTVEEGQTDRPTALQLGNVIATDQYGNTSVAYDFQDIQKFIDANTPTITDFIVPESKMLLGDTIQATIKVVSDTGSYILNSGNVAGFPIDSITREDDTTYYAFFKITNIGYDIQPNQDYSVDSLVLMDFAGNTSDPYSKTISNPNDPIYTTLPTGKVTGNYHECEGDTVELKMQFTGSGPWDIELFNGSSTTVVSGIAENLYYHKLKTVNNSGVDADTIIYKINKITDVNGNVKINDGSDSAKVYVHLLPQANITYPANGRIYNITNQKDTLIGTELLGVFSGSGVFTGNGVLSVSNNFFPPEAGIGDHEIKYNYTTEYGCSDTASIEVTVIESSGTIKFPDHSPLSDYLYCKYENPFMITGSNINSKPGSFYIKNHSGSALVNSNIDTAYIDPGLLNAGDYTVVYTFDDGGIVEIQELLTIDSISNEINFTSIPDQCANYDTINVQANNIFPTGGNGQYEFSGSENAFVYSPSSSGNKIYFLKDSISPGNYHLDYVYTAPSGCKSDTITKFFTVNSLPVVSFTMDPNYSIDQGEIIITGNPAGSTGLFTPLSYMSNNGDGTASFDPKDAGLGDHTVTYTYSDPATGCENFATNDFEVSEAEGEIISLSGSFQYCYFNGQVDTIVGVAYNSDGAEGVFYLNGEIVTPFAKDSIIIDPLNIGSGNHTIRFKYTNQTATYYLEKTFNVDSIGNMSIGGFEDEYCEDDESLIELNAIQPAGEPGANLITGNGVSQDNDNFYFTPSEANIGFNKLNYTFIRDYSGCFRSISDSIKINKLPYVNFSLSDSCFVDDEVITFYSDTLLADSVIQWNWLFDGFIASTEQNPVRQYTSQGEKTIELTLTTNKGCSNSISKNKFIGKKFTPAFEWANECFGETVNFKIITTTDAANIIGFDWDFGDGSTLSINDTTENSNHYFSSPGDYLVKLVEITKTCGSDTVENTVPVRPKVVLSENEYFQDFESGTTDGEGWVAEDLNATSANSWQYGIPSGDMINSASSGDYAWVTSLNGNYANNEKSTVTSPCFDFTSMEKPMLRLDYISATEKDRDGAVIQYTNVNGQWTTLGLPNQGVNWYNSVYISGSPAGQTFGWTGNSSSFVDSAEWKTAMFWLDQLKGRESVRFRIVFGSDAAATDEGFAFDNIWIGERKRIVLLENFVNSTDDHSAEINNEVINPIVVNNPLDVIAVNYHTSFPGLDKMNIFYASGPSARTLFYGISKVPYSVMDGGERQYSYLFTDYLTENDLKARMLIEPDFNISLNHDIQDNRLLVSSTIKARNHFSKSINAQIAIVEKSVESDSKVYNNVLRAMLPDAAGTLIDKDWGIGDSVKVYQTWDIPDEVNPDSLISVIFIQDEVSKEVYQTAFTGELSTITSINNLILPNNAFDFVIYPNPASDNIIIWLANKLHDDLNVYIYNTTGKLVHTGIINKESEFLEMNVNNLTSGIYYVKLTNNESIVRTKKLIINN